MTTDDGVPSAGWRAVYAAQHCSTDAEEDARACPECGADSTPVDAGVYYCVDHGAWSSA